MQRTQSFHLFLCRGNGNLRGIVGVAAAHARRFDGGNQRAGAHLSAFHDAGSKGQDARRGSGSHGRTLCVLNDLAAGLDDAVEGAGLRRHHLHAHKFGLLRLQDYLLTVAVVVAFVALVMVFVIVLVIVVMVGKLVIGIAVVAGTRRAHHGGIGGKHKGNMQFPHVFTFISVLCLLHIHICAKVRIKAERNGIAGCGGGTFAPDVQLFFCVCAALWLPL